MKFGCGAHPKHFNNRREIGACGEMREILKKVLERVKPTKADEKLVKQVVDEIIQRVKAACAKLKIDARPMLVGSVARGTYSKRAVCPSL